MLRRAEIFAGWGSVFVQQGLCKHCQYKQAGGKRQYIPYSRASLHGERDPVLRGPQRCCWPQVFVVCLWGFTVGGIVHTSLVGLTWIFLLTIKWDKIKITINKIKFYTPASSGLMGQGAGMKSMWKGRSSAGNNNSLPTHLLNWVASDPTAMGKAQPATA